MKLHYRKLLQILLAGIIISGLSISGREIAVRSAGDFDQLVVRYNYALVMVYAFDQQIGKNTDLKKKIEELENTFDNLSNRAKYKKSGLVFLKINRAKNDLDTVVKNLEIEQIPAFVLFENGEPIKVGGKPVSLFGFVSRDDLEGFIDRYVGDDLEKTIEDKERRQDIRQEVIVESAPYYDDYWGYPWGWGGYPWYGYYGYPGFGIYYGGRRYYGGHGKRFYGGRRGGRGVRRGPRGTGRRVGGRPQSRMRTGGMRGGGMRRSGIRTGGTRAGGMRRGGMRGGGMRTGGMRGGMRGGGMRGGGMRGGGMRGGGMRGGGGRGGRR